MRRLIPRRPGLNRLALVASAVSLLAVLAAATAAAQSAPLPPGSLALALAGQASAPAPARVGGVSPAADGSICYYGACYNYVAGSQYAYYATGASVSHWRGRPRLDPADAHSLQELAVQWMDKDGNFTEIVEIGWTVDRYVNGDAAPHLFVFHWVDGNPGCYNGCGFVQTSTEIVPGMKMPSGGFTTFGIEHVGDQWQLSLDGTMFGYFPDSLWTGAFPQLLLVQTFGEVASYSTPTCSDMGTGKYAESSASSKIAGFTFLGPYAYPIATFPYLFVTTPEWYDAGQATTTGFRLGGPGTGHCSKN